MKILHSIKRLPMTVGSTGPTFFTILVLVVLSSQVTAFDRARREKRGMTSQFFPPIGIAPSFGLPSLSTPPSASSSSPLDYIPNALPSVYYPAHVTPACVSEPPSPAMVHSLREVLRQKRGETSGFFPPFNIGSPFSSGNFPFFSVPPAAWSPAPVSGLPNAVPPPANYPANGGTPLDQVPNAVPFVYSPGNAPCSSAAPPGPAAWTPARLYPVEMIPADAGCTPGDRPNYLAGTLTISNYQPLNLCLRGDAGAARCGWVCDRGFSAIVASFVCEEAGGPGSYPLTFQTNVPRTSSQQNLKGDYGFTGIVCPALPSSLGDCSYLNYTAFDVFPNECTQDSASDVNLVCSAQNSRSTLSLSDELRAVCDLFGISDMCFDMCASSPSLVACWDGHVRTIRNHEYYGAFYFNESIRALANLDSLKLSGSNVYGPIPESIGALKSLAYLELGGCNLEGTLPASFGGLHSLLEADISNNRLSGPLPSNLQLPRLYQLTLSNNAFEGGIPDLAGVPSLALLSIDHNRLSGTISASIANLQQLATFDASANALTGSIPEFIGNMSKCSKFLVGNNRLSGDLPALVWQMPRLQELQLHDNFLTGTIPSPSNTIPSLTTIGLQNNALSGTIPGALFSRLPRNVYEVNMCNNRLTGSIPDSVFLVKGDYLRLLLCNNALTGELSQAVLNSSSIIPADVSLWDFSFNALSGEIAVLPAVSAIILSHNRFTGGLPKTHWQCNTNWSLSAWDLSYNALAGKLEGTCLPENVLLSNNHFTSSASIASLTMKNLPSGGNYYRGFRNFDLSYNRLQQDLSELLPRDELSCIVSLNLSGNFLTGTIWTQHSCSDWLNGLGCGTGLERVLDVSNNNLTGTDLGQLYTSSLNKPGSDWSFIDLSNNPMMVLASLNLSYLPQNLVELRLQNVGLQKISAAGASLPFLEAVDLSRNILDYDREHPLDISALLVALPLLTELDLSYSRQLAAVSRFRITSSTLTALSFDFSPVDWIIGGIDLSDVSPDTPGVGPELRYDGALTLSCIYCIAKWATHVSRFSVADLAVTTKGEVSFPNIKWISTEGVGTGAATPVELRSRTLLEGMSGCDKDYGTPCHCRVSASAWTLIGSSTWTSTTRLGSVLSGKTLANYFATMYTDPDMLNDLHFILGNGPAQSVALALNTTLVAVHPFELSRVETVNLAASKIRGPLFQGLKYGPGLFSIQQLDLRNNNLSGTFPSILAFAPRLAALDLSQNQLSGPFEPIVRSSTQWAALEWLSIAWNANITIDPQTWYVDHNVLEHLDLAGVNAKGQLQDSAFRCISALQNLSLSHLPEVVGRLPRSVWCCGQELATGSPCHVCDGSLRKLNLSYSGLGSLVWDYPQRAGVGRLHAVDLTGAQLLCDPQWLQQHSAAPACTLPNIEDNYLLQDICALTNSTVQFAGVSRCLQPTWECAYPVNVSSSASSATALCSTNMTENFGRMCWDALNRVYMIPTQSNVSVDFRRCGSSGCVQPGSVYIVPYDPSAISQEGLLDAVAGPADTAFASAAWHRSICGSRPVTLPPSEDRCLSSVVLDLAVPVEVSKINQPALSLRSFMSAVPSAGIHIALCGVVDYGTLPQSTPNKTVQYSGPAVLALFQVTSGLPREVHLDLRVVSETQRFRNPITATISTDNDASVGVTGTLLVQFWAGAGCAESANPCDLLVSYSSILSSSATARFPVSVGDFSVLPGIPLLVNASLNNQATIHQLMVVLDPSVGDWMEPTRLRTGALLFSAPPCIPIEESWYSPSERICRRVCPFSAASGMNCDPPQSACPANFICDGTSVLCLRPGFWRMNGSCVDADALTIPDYAFRADACLAPDVESVCVGDTTNSGCAVGYRGILCGECEEDYLYTDRSECVPCKSSAASWTIAFFIVLAGILWIGALTMTQVWAASRQAAGFSLGRGDNPFESRGATTVTLMSSAMDKDAFVPPSLISGVNDADHVPSKTPSVLPVPVSNAGIAPDAVQQGESDPPLHESSHEDPVSAVLSTYLKLLLAYMQMSVALDRLDVDWPGPVQQLHEASASILSLFDLIWIRCAVPALKSFSNRMTIITIAFLCLASITLVGLRYLLYQKRGGATYPLPTMHGSSKMRLVLRSLFRPYTILLLLSLCTFVLYQPMVNAVTMSFVDIGVSSIAHPGSSNWTFYMLADLSVAIDSSTGRAIQAEAVILIIFGIIGYPLMVGLLLRAFRPWLRNCSVVGSVMGFYVVGYRPGAEWFELLRMGFGALSVVTSAAQSALFQVSVIMCILLLQLTLTLSVRPYSDASAHRLQIVSLSIMLLQLILTVSMTTSSSAGEVSAVAPSSFELAVHKLTPTLMLLGDISIILAFVYELLSTALDLDFVRLRYDKVAAIVQRRYRVLKHSVTSLFRRDDRRGFSKEALSPLMVYDEFESN